MLRESEAGERSVAQVPSPHPPAEQPAGGPGQEIEDGMDADLHEAQSNTLDTSGMGFRRALVSRQPQTPAAKPGTPTIAE